MKNVAYIKREIVDRGRVISVREKQEEKDCTTKVMKNFVYLVSPANAIPQEIDPPVIHITKKISTERKTEVFLFKVKGDIYVKEKRFIYRVQYSHSLCVHLCWKNHVLSTKPAALA